MTGHAYTLLGLILGFGVGLLHFASLKRVTAMYLSGTATARAVALQLGRLALVAVLLVFLALKGAMPLLAGALGLLLARIVVLRLNRSEE
ncbi:F1-F0 ATPase (N-ATPase) AtpR subunit [Celeribacter persicus]|uniref:F1-F0 ATPase (N-ATPase) AtpR subunit n=2 Tax=Celeribacter persicus TaxID=1651082 RepID=A0A2T5HTI9_9RHOB|nr:F1-F0 ATPase (N-ATPase) AtpR subunit [Celeribacter persicus]